MTQSHRRRALLIASLAAATLVGACATETPYRAVEGGSYGYSEQKIEENTYRIVFKGNQFTSRETVENYLLYRAAEFTLQHGYDHFAVVAADMDVERDYDAVPTTGGFYRPGFFRFPYSSYGFPWTYQSWGGDAVVRETRRFSAHAYIVLGKGSTGDDPRALDAGEVIENLSPIIDRP